MNSIERLLEIMDELRERCPWDKKQTFQSLRKLTLEEVYELTDSIDNNNPEEIKKELGDVLLHLVFYSKMASEKDWFNFSDVVHSICDKLIHRHPHIYSDVEVKNEEEVKKNWEKLKMKEGRKSILEGVPKALPAMLKSYRIQEKVKSVGFDWDDKKDAWKKVEEELEEFKIEQVLNDSEKSKEEFGDLLFSLINYSRIAGIDPDEALESTNQKFINRFQFIESKSQNTGIPLEEMSLEEMDKYWEEAKKQ